MSALCGSQCCPTANLSPPVSYDTCTRTTRSSGAKYFGLISCAFGFTDITDPAEWDAAIADGDIQCSPLGNVTVNAPSQTVLDINRCGDKIITDGEYLIDFTTLLVAEDNSDFQYYKALEEGAGNYKLFWVDCNGLFYFCTEAVDLINAGTFDIGATTGISAGFDYSITQTPYQADNSDLVEWTTQFSITQKGVICGVELPAVNICC